MSGNLIYNNASKILSQLHIDLDQMQVQVDGGSTYCATAGQIHSNLETLRQSAKDLSDVAKREITTVKREKAVVRSNQMQADYQSLRMKYDELKKRQQDMDAPMTDTSAILMMDGLLKEDEILNSSGNRIDEFTHMARASLNELYGQREILKSTQKRMYDVANRLGLSSTTIKYIEKRAVQDRWILFGGMVVTVVLMWLIARFFGGKK
ncbi:Golgi SNAP receptor complex member 2 [Podochytrium sp. JEL0797]|nr:Golgi SNAP receptor complex member 2 [Podochytrium sp. JEL0797]